MLVPAAIGLRRQSRWWSGQPWVYPIHLRLAAQQMAYQRARDGVLTLSLHAAHSLDIVLCETP
jgi:hypothetical protein